MKKLYILFLILLVPFISGFNFGQSTTTTINSTSIFLNGSEVLHNDLSDLQGGVANQYYHLTLAWYNDISADIGNWITGTEADTKIATANTSLAYYANTTVNNSMKSYVDLLNSTGLIKNWNASGLIKDWGTFSETFWNGNYSNFSIIYAYALNSSNNWNGNYSDFLVGYNYAINSTGGVETFWNGNYSDYLVIKSYALNDSIWSLNYSNFSIGWAYAINSTGGEEILWNGNYTNFSTIYGYALNSSTNPFAFYNVTTAPIYLNDTFRGNYSNYTIGWLYATNSTASWSDVMNGTLFKRVDWDNNYSTNNDAWLNTTNITYNTWAYNQTTPAVNIILGYSYYNSTNAPIYLNDTFRANYSAYLSYLNYHSNNTWSYYNSTTAPIYLNDTFGNNYSNYLLKPLWSDAMNGTLAKTSDLSSYYALNNPYGYYNSTTAPIYLNDTFRNNYSNYTTGWLYATNSTGTLTAETLWNNNFSNFSVTNAYALNNSRWSLNYSNFSVGFAYALNGSSYWNANYSTFLTHIDWSKILNGTLWTTNMNGTLMKSADWNATNTSYYLVTNPYSYYNSSSFNLSQTYNNSNIATVDGVYYSGDNDSIRFFDTNYYIVNESMVSPFTIYINFTGITTFDSIIMREQYDGSLGHEVLLEIYNYDSSSWVSYSEITDQGGFVISIVPVINPSSLVSGGVVQTRLRHLGGGTITHVMYIDYFVLQKGTTTITNSEHDSLSGRDSISNHPWALDINGERNATNISVTNNVTASWFLGLINHSQIQNFPNYLMSETFWNANYSNYTTGWLYAINNSINPFAYYNSTTAPIYLNDTFRNNYSNYLSYLNYHLNNTFSYYNSTSAPIYLNDTFRGNLSNFTTVYTYATNYSYPIYLNDTFRGNISNFTTTHYYALNDSRWSLNYSNFTTGWLYATNSTGTLTVDTFANNYSTYLTHITWANAVNGTLMNNTWWNTNYSTNDPVYRSFSNNYSNYLLKPLWSDVMNGTVVANIPIYLNDTFRNNYSSYLSYLNYHFNNTFAYYNSTTAPIYLNDTFRNNYSNFTTGWLYATNSTGTLTAETLWNNNFSNFSVTNAYALNGSSLWNANYSTYLLKPSWANVLNGTVLTNWTSNYTNGVFSQGKNLSTGYAYALNDSRWSLNYSNFSTGWQNANSWLNNYSNYLLKPLWSDAMNNTLTQWSQAYNGTLAKVGSINTWTANQTLGNQYITNGTGGAYIYHNGTGWVIKG